MRALRKWFAAAAAMFLTAPAAFAQLPGVPGLPGLPPARGGEGFTVMAVLKPDGQAPGHPVVAEVTFTCPDRWLIYADTIGVELAAAGGGTVVSALGAPVLPTPHHKPDPFTSEDVEYLDGEFTVRLALQVAQDAAPGEHGVSLAIRYQGCSDTVCFQARTQSSDLTLTVLGPDASPVDVDLPAVPQETQGRGFFVLILLAYGAGLGLALTPCVWPLIPITISVIGATGGGTRIGALVRSLCYVFGIALMYALLGAIAGSTGRVLGTLLQHPAVYVALAVVMALLAAAMFDVFTLQVAGSWTQRLQTRLRGRYGLVGIFAMGLLSGIACTACTTPVVAALLLPVLQRADPLAGFALMFTMAAGMGTPLVVLGTFSGLVRAMPKSGDWQDAVKLLFGLGLAGGALYFLGLGYLLAPAAFEVLVGACLLAGGIAVFAGVSGFMPRAAGTTRRLRKVFGLLLAASSIAFFAPLLLPTPPAVEWTASLDEALAQGKAQDKPVMIYFWQERCAECAHLKKKTFPDDGVIAESERFIRAAVDGTRWPSDEQERMREEYGVQGFPAIAFVTSDGQVLKGKLGFQSPEELLAAMRAVR